MNNAIKALQITYRYLKENKHARSIDSTIRKKWAYEIFSALNFNIQKDRAIQSDGPVVFVSNHISYMDIPLLLATLDNCVFVAKKEILRWPIFGAAGQKIDTVFLDRNSSQSRLAARNEIEAQLKLSKKKIVVFPSGTTSITGEKFWRKGSFEVAQKLGIPIQPVRISYSHLRTVAYIDRDFFPYHLLQLAKLDKITAKIEIHRPLFIQNIESDLEYCRHWCTTKSKSFK